MSQIMFKYNNDIAEAIQTMEEQDFAYPQMPQSIIKKDETRKEVEINPSEAKIFMWKQLWDKMNDHLFDDKKIIKLCTL